MSVEKWVDSESAACDYCGDSPCFSLFGGDVLCSSCYRMTVDEMDVPEYAGNDTEPDTPLRNRQQRQTIEAEVMDHDVD